MTAIQIVESHRAGDERCLAAVRAAVERLWALGMTDPEILAGLEQAWRAESSKRAAHGQKDKPRKVDADA